MRARDSILGWNLSAKLILIIFLLINSLFVSLQFEYLIMTNDIDKIIVVGDRVLIRPNDSTDRTRSGLYLPAGYHDKENVQSGYILKCGPGYPLPSMDEGEAWNQRNDAPRYLPLQVQPGDLALFLQKNAIEIKYNNEKLFIVPQNAILLVEREEF